jgi:hypothetical protein
MRRLVAVVLLLVLAGCGGGSAAKPGGDAKAKTIAVIGDITVKSSTASVVKPGADIGSPCDADSGYEDIRAGTQVVIADDGGKTLALGTLDDGTLGGQPGDEILELRCSFPFEVLGVPTGHPFYRVSVGRRGGQQYTAADLAQPIHLELS